MRAVAVTHSAPAPFDALDPGAVFAAAESIGLEPSGRLFALNSYENRVYQLGDEDGALWVLKFYRPARWSDAQIAEEHAFTFELAAAELPVAAPHACATAQACLSIGACASPRFRTWPGARRSSTTTPRSPC